MFKVGVTGGIGSGKTTVTNMLKDFGVDIIDADEVARELVQPGTPTLAAIQQKYGPDILLPDGSLNRARLRARVFTTPEEKTWLEALLHPLIMQLCEERLEQVRSTYAVLSSPLLIETGQHKLVDRVLVVDIPEALQLSRTTSRDNSSPEQIQQIIDSQLSRQERLSHADDILDNSLDEQQLRLAVEKLHIDYLKFAQE